MNSNVMTQQGIVDHINAIFQFGEKVRVRQDDGSIAEWTLRHEATMLGGHTAVIWTEEHRSAYAADRVIF